MRRRLVWVGLLVALVLVMLPTRAFAIEDATTPFDDAVQVGLADGEYQVDVTLEGGTGRASVASPAQMIVQQGKAALVVVWSSPNYDYMLVANKRYLPTNMNGNSTFIIPALAMDEAFEVTADTTAMSVPHEIEYRLTIDASSAKMGNTQDFMTVLLPVIVAGVCLGIVVARRRATS